MSPRSAQIAAEIQRELSNLVTNEVRDPRISYVTIIRVDLSDDLGSARVFVSEIPTEGRREGEAVEALERAAGFLRRELGKRMRLRHTPELRFIADHSIEEGIRMTQIIDGLDDADTGDDRDDSE